MRRVPSRATRDTVLRWDGSAMVHSRHGLTKSIAGALAVCLMVAAFGGSAHTAEACPSCKQVVPTEGDGSGGSGDSARGVDDTLAPTAGRGYNYSIFLLMAAPFVLASVFGGILYLVIRKPAVLGLR